MKTILYLIIPVLLFSCSEIDLDTADKTTITCDMETTSGPNYISGQVELGKAYTQSDKEAKRGMYSAAVNKEKQYALDYKFKNVKKGNYISISVWRKSSTKKGVLSLSSDENKILFVTNLPIKKENGWELLEITYLAEKDFSFLKTYVYNPNEEPVYFDDLTITFWKQKPAPPLNSNSLKINLTSKNLETLTKLRNDALKNGVIGKDQKQYIKGEITYNGNIIPIKLRLKGDWTDHLEKEKWSLRIKVLGDNSVLGLKSFSIQSPHTRAFLREWSIHKLFEQEDVLTTRYTFSTVSINNNNLGIYAVEEHFDKQLIEAKNRREGPIVKFDEEGFWELNRLGKTEGKWLFVDYFSSADILPFKKKRTFGNDVLKSNFKKAEKLMLLYKELDVDLHKVFDLENLAKYYALSDLGNVSHGLRWHNMRLYYNPVTSALEQIAYDCFTERLFEKRCAILGFDKENLNRTKENYLTYKVFNDKTFKEKYIKYLKIYSDPNFITKFYLSIEEELDSLEKWIKIESPNYEEDKSFFRNNAKAILNDLEEYRSSNLNFTSYAPTISDLSNLPVYFPSVGLKSTQFKTNDTSKIDVFISNYHPKKITIIGYSLARDTVYTTLQKKHTLNGYLDESQIQKLTLPKRAKKLYFTVSNIPDSIFSSKIGKWSCSSKTLSNGFGSLSPNIDAFNFIEVDNKTIFFKKGDHYLNKTLIIPEGYTVAISSGTSINLMNNAAIISHSPMILNGSKKENIRIYSSDNTGQGLVILNHNEKSIFKYVVFDNLSSLNQNGWFLTGAVSIYQSDITIDNCVFKNNHCEDGLNLIRSKFSFNNSNIENTYSDGFDADFCTGTVTNSSFINSKNDCIDFSGSTIEIYNCTINKAGDKGISGGEKSTLIVKYCTLENINIGITAKDKTTINVENVFLKNAECGYAAYQKKPEYGGAKISIKNSTEENIKNIILVDLGSEIIHHGNSHISKLKINVDSLYSMFP